MVVTSVKQDCIWIELSVAVKRIYVNRTKAIHKRLNFLRSRLFPRGWVVSDWRLSQPGFHPSFVNLACLATLKSCDTTKQSVCEWQYIYIYIYGGVRLFECALHIHNYKGKVVDLSREWPEGSFFNSYDTEVLGRALLHSLDCFTLPSIVTL